MRSKNILSTVAFVAAFVLSAAFASLFISRPADTPSYTLTSESNYQPYCKFKKSKNYNAAEISTLIAADRANFSAQGKKMYSFYNESPTKKDAAEFAEYAATVEIYVNESSGLAVENLPTDFALAWNEHLNAWREYSDYLNEVANNFDDGLPTQEVYKQADKTYNQEITRTWLNVLRIGKSYSVDAR